MIQSANKIIWLTIYEVIATYCNIKEQRELYML